MDSVLNKEILATSVQEIVSLIPTIVQDYPGGPFHRISSWCDRGTEVIQEMRNRTRTLSDPDVTNRFYEDLRICEEVIGELPVASNIEGKFVNFKTAVNRIAVLLAEQRPQGEMPHHRKIVVPLRELPKERPDVFSLDRTTYRGVDVFELSMRLPGEGNLGKIRIPDDPRVLLKGGEARVVLKGLVTHPGLDKRFIKSEFPRSDSDGLIRIVEDLASKTKCTTFE